MFRADGGRVDAGQAYNASDGGQDLFIPNRNGQIVPIAAGDGSGGGQSIDNSRTYSIDARGAQHGVAEQITAALHQCDAGLNRALGARVDTSRRRYR